MSGAIQGQLDVVKRVIAFDGVVLGEHFGEESLQVGNGVEGEGTANWNRVLPRIGHKSILPGEFGVVAHARLQFLYSHDLVARKDDRENVDEQLPRKHRILLVPINGS